MRNRRVHIDLGGREQHTVVVRVHDRQRCRDGRQACWERVPVQGARVEVWRQGADGELDDELLGAATTDERGAATFENLPAASSARLLIDGWPWPEHEPELAELMQQAERHRDHEEARRARAEEEEARRARAEEEEARRARAEEEEARRARAEEEEARRARAEEDAQCAEQAAGPSGVRGVALGELLLHALTSSLRRAPRLRGGHTFQLAMTAAGFMEGRSYLEAVDRLERGDPEAAVRFVDMVRRMGGGNTTATVILLRRRLESVGLALTVAQASFLAKCGLAQSPAGAGR